MKPDTKRHRPMTVGPSVRAGIRVCLVSAALILAGCTVQTGLPGPSVIFDTPVGPVPLNPPAPVMAGGAMPGPPGAVPGQPVSLDGSYAGSAVVLTTDGGLCTKPLILSGMLVQGGSVRFGRFDGVIDPYGGLQMTYAGMWIVGQFEGPVFHGQLSVPGPRDAPGCTYLVGLARTGP
jgi:hypothetical protein